MISLNQAVQAAKDRFCERWVGLAPKLQTQAIYDEMRRLDAEAYWINQGTVTKLEVRTPSGA